ncbi:MAG: hypothetical protein EHM32_06720 [Spirochaetales bacterium]|nr:MAG: hypothetical protein EHM32_06720 [Spirochaetales bacterium]
MNGIWPMIYPPSFRTIRTAAAVLAMFAFLLVPQSIVRREFPAYSVVLDPGHGGMSLPDRSRHGDRYDALSGTYLQPFKEGASWGAIEEHAVVYEIARKAADIIAMCGEGGDFNRFSRLLERYSAVPPRRVFVDVSLSRGDSRDRGGIRRREDPNGEFRLFDHPGPDGKMRPGRISRINAMRPHLVVCLHIARSGSPYFRGMNPVIAPPFGFMYKGLKVLRGEKSDRSFFFSSPYAEWFDESNDRTGYKWFLNDSMLYFGGFPLDARGKVDMAGFKGYRHNMVDWPYRDSPGWENVARSHPDYTPYAANPGTISLTGRYWDRERSEFERFRRDGGEEGYGGDNHYASAEIIRYILMALRLNNVGHPDQRLSKPYVSVWHMPLFLNAITAFMELGYFNRPQFRYILTARQDEIAEGIAVGVYSLLAGMEPRDGGGARGPRGKRIDLEKYRDSNEKSYFDAAAFPGR